MEQRFFRFLQGYVRFQFSGSTPERFWNLCAHHEIFLFCLTPAENGYEACVSKRDFFRLKNIVRKSHTRIRIVRRYGIPFFIHRHRSRWAASGGALAALIFMIWLSAHIWKINVVGNLFLTDDIIFEYLENEGISHGIWKNQIDTQTLSDRLRDYFTQLSWVSTELQGTRLTIYVKEGITDTGQTETDESSLTGIAASKAGTVISIYVRKGLALVKAGDTVSPGDLLVSGQIPIYNDDGTAVSMQTVIADADIVLRTETEYQDKIAYETTLKNYTGESSSRFMLRILGVSFALPDLKENFSDADVTCEIQQASLSENYYLPVYLYKYTWKEYELLKYSYTSEQAEQILNQNLSVFKEKLEEKGVQIFENNVTIGLYENAAVASGILITDESAVVRAEESMWEEEPKE